MFFLLPGRQRVFRLGLPFWKIVADGNAGKKPVIGNSQLKKPPRCRAFKTRQILSLYRSIFSTNIELLDGCARIWWIWLYNIIFLPRNQRQKKKCLRLLRRKITPHEFCCLCGLKPPLDKKTHQTLGFTKHLDSPWPLLHFCSRKAQN